MDTDHPVRERLSLITFIRIFLRSFFIQGSFSQKYRQNTGFAFCMEPVGRELWKSDDDRRAFLARHLEYYNGNPFMITLVLGATARLEEMLKRGEIGESTISGFKKAVGAATGSIGDRFFWGTLRPFAVIAGIAASLISSWHGVILTFIIFNLAGISLRFYWLKRGYQLGTGVVGEIQNRSILLALRIMETGTAVLLAFLSVFFISRHSGGINLTFAATTALFVISLVLYKKYRHIPKVLAYSLIIAVATGLVITIFMT